MAEPITATQIQEMLDASPFISFMNLEVLSAEQQSQTVVMRMPMRPEFERRAGTG